MVYWALIHLENAITKHTWAHTMIIYYLGKVPSDYVQIEYYLKHLKRQGHCCYKLLYHIITSIPWLPVGNGQSSPRQMPRSTRCNSLDTRVKNSNVGPNPVPAYNMMIITRSTNAVLLPHPHSESLACSWWNQDHWSPSQLAPTGYLVKHNAVQVIITVMILSM